MEPKYGTFFLRTFTEGSGSAIAQVPELLPTCFEIIVLVRAIHGVFAANAEQTTFALKNPVEWPILHLHLAISLCHEPGKSHPV